MRSIRLIVVLSLLFAVMASKVKAANNIESTDTKIKFQKSLENKLNISQDPLEEAKKLFSEVENPVVEQKDARTEDILAKWKNKQTDRWSNLPQGKFTINASAYTAAADECGKNDGITASGVKVEAKRTLACPGNFPFGAKLKIEGFGTFVCEDRGGAIKGNKIDIYMQTKTEAFQFGRRNLIAEVVM